MDGLEATRRIRSAEVEGKKFNHIIIIGLSANSDKDTLQEAKGDGFDAFLVKPFSYYRFKSLMEELDYHI